MKKMMMMVLAASLAGLANAAVVNWGNGSSSLVVGIDGSTGLYQGTAGLSAFNIYLVPTVADPFKPALADAIGGSATLSTMVASAGALSGAGGIYQYGTDFSAGDSFYAYATMTYNGVNYFMVVDAGTWELTAVNNGGTDAFTWAAGVYGGLAVNATDLNKWHVVPEPTSAALLALGVAALGLRRKFRA